MTLPFQQHASVISIGQASGEHLGRILTILRDNWHSLYQGKVAPDRLDAYIDHHVRPVYESHIFSNSGDNRILTATIGGITQGFICFGMREERHHIDALYVDPPNKRQSIGTLLLMQAAKNMADENNSLPVAFHVCISNDDAIAYARSFGGERKGSITRKFMDDIDIIDQIIKWPNPQALIDKLDEWRRLHMGLPASATSASREWRPR